MNSRSTTESTSSPFVILHLAPLQWGKIAGLNVSIPSLVHAQSLHDNVRTALILTAAVRNAPEDVDFPVFDARQLLRTPRGFDLPPPFDHPHLAVFHSTYIPIHARIARKFRCQQLPYILCPRGGMTQHAQSFKRWKKWLGNLLFFDRLVTGAAALQYLTFGEQADSGDWNRPTFVVGNGVHPPAETDLATPGSNQTLRLVFLGRLAIKHKGLDLLLDACSLLRTALRERGTRIELYGPDQQGSTKYLAHRLAQLDLTDLVVLNGPVYGTAKATVLRQADVFLHTSRWEGHPNAILEALSYGVPCFVTPGTNMAEEIAAAGAGWIASLSPSGIAEGLQKVLDADRQTLQLFGTKARQWIVQNHTWPQIASRTTEFYRRFAA